MESNENSEDKPDHSEPKLDDSSEAAAEDNNSTVGEQQDSLETKEEVEPSETIPEKSESEAPSAEITSEQEVAEEPTSEEKEEFEEPEFEKGIFAIKTSIGHEKMVADTLEGRIKRRKADVYSIMLPPNLRGYLLIEALDNREALRDLIKGVQHARTLVEGTTTIEEIESFLAPKPIVSGIEEGDIVEVIAGPFKGEKAKVKQIDLPKEEITIELFEAMVSIPVTIRGDHVRVLEKESS